MLKCLNIAHRGGAALWPENTLFAFRSAAKAGFAGAELDVQMTRDGKLVVFHDFRLKPSLCRAANGRWLARAGLPLIKDLAWDELQHYDVGRPKPRSLYALRHPNLTPQDGERMPSLAAVIRTVRTINPEFRLFVEIKTSARDRSLSAAPEDVAAEVVAELRKEDFFGNAILVGFDWTALGHAKKLAPLLPCWFTTDRGSRRGAAAIAKAGGDGWFTSKERANARSARAAHDHGLDFGAWTVNNRREMQALIALGAGAICTDRPDRLQQLLSQT